MCEQWYKIKLYGYQIDNGRDRVKKVSLGLLNPIVILITYIKLPLNCSIDKMWQLKMFKVLYLLVNFPLSWLQVCYVLLFLNKRKFGMDCQIKLKYFSKRHYWDFLVTKLKKI